MALLIVLLRLEICKQLLQELYKGGAPLSTLDHHPVPPALVHVALKLAREPLGIQAALAGKRRLVNTLQEYVGFLQQVAASHAFRLVRRALKRAPEPSTEQLLEVCLVQQRVLRRKMSRVVCAHGARVLLSLSLLLSVSGRLAGRCRRRWPPPRRGRARQRTPALWPLPVLVPLFLSIPPILARASLIALVRR